MKKETFYRWLLYICGMILLALGISLNTKTGLGMPPLTTIAFVASDLSGWSFGNTCLASYIVFMLLQVLLRGKKYPLTDLLQLPLSIVFTRFLDIFKAILPEQTEILGQIIFLILAMVLTGIGAAMTLNMRLIPNPADGLVQAMSDVSGKSIGLCKNVLDLSVVAITVVTGLVFRGRVYGIGIGTLAAMIVIGRVMAVFNHFFKERMLKAAGM